MTIRTYIEASLVREALRYTVLAILAASSGLLSFAKYSVQANQSKTTQNPSVASSRIPPKIFTNRYGIELVYVSPGEFMMGSEREYPVHRVRISSGFYIGRYEVTQRQWLAAIGSNPSHFKGENLPVERVSYLDAQTFLIKLNGLNDDYEYRLPTEAEWEYACRAGTTGDFYGNPGEIAWYSETADKQTHPVGTKQPNAFGLFDMSGNVWEWCADHWHDDYNGAPPDGMAWIKGGSENRHPLRGGAWNFFAADIRSANRGVSTIDDRSPDIGLRVAAMRKR